ncbi:hypothetical protein [Colwellia hornerae]|uniref:Right handed beta helix domain-containing protein n=2 Tax=Colwellia hornerae TaxID=89402 RepID=A0A5C6QID3_9GAMM|nr:hypothetical protein [Colwellia hornerae]TWX52484.1 hypothetical protein ESZ28_12545 [Colwellia hornerae]TWX58313.1 hypothetical protein ESZ26_12510 [Colwellia hornerae]TWX68342.1 hypothetical protein ESZ27_06945 [Colwellia hornerae]
MKYLCFMLFFVQFNLFAEHVFVDGKEFFSLQDAKSAIKDGSQVFLKAGIYTKGLYIKANNVEIIGEKGVVFDNAAIDNKAALVLTGKNILVESIECINISVRAGNGACIRFEGENLTVRDLYVHDSESGIMTSTVPGYVNIEFSIFERLGSRRGYSHGVYIKADELNIRYSKFLNTKKQGSSIKSRSKKVLIENSIIATMDSVDSRAVDMAKYGELIIRNSILQQGNNSSNSQLLAYGLEKKAERVFDVNRVEITNNLIFFDREKSNVYMAYRLLDEFINKNNIFIGDFNNPNKFIKNNKWYISREKAGLKAYPFLPTLDQVQGTLALIEVLGNSEN